MIKGALLAMLGSGCVATVQPQPVVVAPIDVRVNGNISSGGTTACGYDADCGPGRACRAIAGGTMVCMGGGGQGDYCDFDNDCLSASCALADRGNKYCR